MADALSLKGAFQGMIPTSAELMVGIVISTSPLKIQMVNDEKLVIGAAITVVPRHLTNYTTKVTISGGSLSGSTTYNSLHSHGYASFTDTMADMTVYNALKKGEMVHVLALQNGKKYYVLDRVN